MLLGFIIGRIKWRIDHMEKCYTSKLKFIDQASSLGDYKRECDLSCYPCNHDNMGTTSRGVSCKESVCPDVSGDPTDVVYVLYTSGTTGHPKMVCVPHSSIVPNIVDLRSRFNINCDDVIFSAAPLTFDPSYVEVHFYLMRIVHTTSL